MALSYGTPLSQVNRKYQNVSSLNLISHSSSTTNFAIAFMQVQLGKSAISCRLLTSNGVVFRCVRVVVLPGFEWCPGLTILLSTRVPVKQTMES